MKLSISFVLTFLVSTIVFSSFGTDAQSTTDILTPDPENNPDLRIMLSNKNESCTEACTRENLVCSSDSLSASNAYGLIDSINATASSFSIFQEGCRSDRLYSGTNGGNRPLVRAGGSQRCWASIEPRTNFWCNNRSLKNNRICGCFFVPSASPTISAVPSDLPSLSSVPSTLPTSSPTISASPSSSPTSDPTSMPTASPSASPTNTPSAQPSSSPTTYLNEVIFDHETEQDIRILVGWRGETCTSACTRHDLQCNGDTLRKADAYFTNVTMGSTMSQLGETCNILNDNGMQWRTRPNIRWSDNRCYPSNPVGRTDSQYSCSKAVSTSVSRICGCSYTPSSSPTTSKVPSTLPTASTEPSLLPTSNPTISASPSSSPTTDPTSMPTSSPSVSPTNTPTAQPSDAPTTYLNKIVYEHETTEDLHILTSWIGESCTDACARHDLSCNWNSLSEANGYLLFDTMNATMTKLGESCQTFRDSGQEGSARANIRWYNRQCFPSIASRTNFNCGRVAGSTQSRICGCWYTPSSAPTTSAKPSDLPSLSSAPTSTPTSSPTISASPSSSPTSDPTSMPTASPSVSPTNTPSAQPSSSPTTYLNEVIFDHETEQDIHILVGWRGESCTSACNRHDFQCSDNTLRKADEYLSNVTMSNTMIQLGEMCNVIHDDGTYGSNRPKIRWSDNRCYPSNPVGRTDSTYKCWNLPQSSESRVCGCKYTPSSSPTTSKVPSTSPTVTASLDPTSSPSSQPTAAPSPRPTFGNIEDVDESSPLSLEIAPEGEVRTLVKHSIDPETGLERLTPIGRSYDGRPWEGQKPYDLSFVVDGSGGYTVDLEPSGDDSKYQLRSYVRAFDVDGTTLSKQNIEVTKFLERTTFGPTRESISTWNYASPAAWVSEQMNEAITPATIHRQFYRERAGTDIRASINAGAPRHPCEQYSRWRRVAFSRLDFERKLTIKGNASSYVVYVDGEPRTEITSASGLWTNVQLVENTEYKICSKPSNVHGGNIGIAFDSFSCTKPTGGNPYVTFSNSLPANYIQLPVNDVDTALFEEVDAAIYHSDLRQLSVSMNDDKCSSIPVSTTESLFGLTMDGSYFINVPMLEWKDNELQSALPDGGGAAFQYGAYCANAPRTFLNEKDCFVSTDAETCGPTKFAEAHFDLDDANIRRLYELSKRYVYSVSLHMEEGSSGLDIETYSPCKADTRSRWMVVNDTNGCIDHISDISTKQALVNLLESSSDTLNPYMRDVQTPELGFPCVNINVTGTKLYADGRCWEHVHPDHFNVYDMTYWTRLDTHMGNQVRKDRGEPNPIKQFAKDGNAVLTFPHWHEIYRWEIKKENFPKLGRYGDDVRFLDLPIELRIEEIAVEFGAQGESEFGEGVVVCGSPGEVANDHSYTNNIFDVAFSGRLDSTGSEWDFEHQAQTTFNNIALKSDDQLRQRTAWALSQILALATDDIESPHETEIYLHYYDIFVRNAFGNYRDVLKEVSYSAMMAEMLSFLKSKSSQYIYDELKEVDVYPDENYAREVMQLFSIGLAPLNMDGTRAGEPNDETYNDDDIQDGARAWTGFDRQNPRGNIELFQKTNRIDPLTADGYWRDAYPKMDLRGGYIGDTFPLCVDLPDKAFLKHGAKYRLLGSSSDPELMYDTSSWDHDPSIRRIILTPGDGTTLYDALAGSNGASIVQLENNVNCNGMDCDVDTVRVVKVGDMFYEYQKVPCVQMAFYSNGMKIKGNSKSSKAMCANPGLPAAAEACCDTSTTFVRNCEYVGERMTYDRAVSRCSAVTKFDGTVTNPLGLCDFKSNRGENGCSTRDFDKCDCAKFNKLHWTDISCTIQVKINEPLSNDEDPKVAIVHKPSTINSYGVKHAFSIESRNWFRVDWEVSTSIPTPSNNCTDAGAVCENHGTFCLCETTVIEQAVFGVGSPMPADDAAVIDQLRIGSVPPHAYPAGTYTADNAYNINGVQVWIRSTSEVVDEDTIFEVARYGETTYYKNIASKVEVGTNSVFRNAPHFVTLSDPTRAETIDETEAVLDNYFYHPNTAPFIAYNLIQRFGVSNPSARMVQRVSSAFYSGVFGPIDGHIFGKNKYGDLNATIAAIVLDPESTSVSLEAEPSSGSLKEPLLKVLSFMRAMEYDDDDGIPLTIIFKLDQYIGQEAHRIPSVFSWFLPAYEAPGRMAPADLVAPEAYDITSPKVIGLMSGLFSMVKYGLGNTCDQGFGAINCGNRQEGDYTKSYGRLRYSPTNLILDDVISEMCLLLTAGRCSRRSQQIIKDAAFPEGTYSVEGLRKAQQLFVTMPEFNSLSVIEMNGEDRPVPEEATESDRPYKAVVLLFLAGGCDSYNMLMPKNCPMYDEYANIRGRLALFDNDTLPINAGTVQDCNCTEFGVNPMLPILHQLYEQGDAVFFANTGNMFGPLDKSNYKQVMETNLFAHDKQQRDNRLVDPYQNVPDTGILGRLSDALTALDYKTSTISVVGTSEALVGEPLKGPPPNYLSYKGVFPFDPSPSSVDMLPAIMDLNDATTISSGMMGDYWSNLVTDSLYQNEAFYDAVSQAVVGTTFPETQIGEQLEFISGLISTHKMRGKDREMFYLKLGGFDTHKNMNTTLDLRFTDMNDAISSFRDEMVHQELWDNVTLIIASDFGRTLTPNSGDGSDHAWAGNYFAIGGDLNGGKVHGQYPTNLTTDGPYNLGRGRLIPTTPWESPWSAIAEWCGIPRDNLASVLPNIGKFEDIVLTRADLYNSQQ